MNIKVYELCSYGQTADFEAIDFTGNNLDFDYSPNGWTSKGGNDDARKFTRDGMTIEVFREGRLILLDAPFELGENIAREILSNWRRGS
ncbi:MAG TPA: hypothetical protein PKV16_03590 [Caldisericia bacterium]|nr:hypothetical protein [Caldisericia bacterium]HPF48394.1 hypothetical protein [Caldisericia bacterium]HPI83426.1 hypothetical protein [Caldisericia bacterium]HPQ92848.1 hypothetical protein [Caldisericia bacterium]HRV74054.1 hypothetical protein [Caldisericia bacterium]